MVAIRKITVSVPETSLAFISKELGIGPSEAVRAGLARLQRDAAYAAARRLRGSMTIRTPIAELKGEDEDA